MCLTGLFARPYFKRFAYILFYMTLAFPVLTEACIWLKSADGHFAHAVLGVSC